MPGQKVGPRSRPSPPPFRQVVAWMVDFLTDPDDEVRRESLADARRLLRPPFQAPVLDGLIGRLQHEGPGMRGRAAQALAGLGLPALQPVVRELLRRRNVLVRVRLVQVLADLRPALTPELRQQLARLLERVGAGDRSGLLARACATAVAALRRYEGGSLVREAGTAGAG